MTTPESTPARDLKLFWWTFAVRGGLALIFAAVLFLASIFLGIFFFDPVTLVYLSLLLGSFVLGNGLLLGVAAAFAWEHRLHLWLHMAIECGAAVLFGAYIGVTLMMTAKSLAFLAGLHAVGNAGFQAALGIKLREQPVNLLLLGFASIVSLAVGVLFLMHVHQAPRTTTQALAGFELFNGLLWIGLSASLRS